jgi:hypothetical protein
MPARWGVAAVARHCARQHPPLVSARERRGQRPDLGVVRRYLDERVFSRWHCDRGLSDKRPCQRESEGHDIRPCSPEHIDRPADGGGDPLAELRVQHLHQARLPGRAAVAPYLARRRGGPAFQKLSLSVPIAAKSTTTFSFHTPAGGTYAWHCQDPCGIGPVGWGGAMSTDGYMQGHVTFA